MSPGWGAQLRSPVRMTGFCLPRLARCPEKAVSQAFRRYSRRFRPSPALGTYAFTTACEVMRVVKTGSGHPLSHRFVVLRVTEGQLQGFRVTVRLQLRLCLSHSYPSGLSGLSDKKECSRQRSMHTIEVWILCCDDSPLLVVLLYVEPHAHGQRLLPARQQTITPWCFSLLLGTCKGWRSDESADW